MLVGLEGKISLYLERSMYKRWGVMKHTCVNGAGSMSEVSSCALRTAGMGFTGCANVWYYVVRATIVIFRCISVESRCENESILSI